MHYQEDKNLSFERSQEGSFGKNQHLQDMYDERIASLTKQLQIFFTEIENDEIFKAMQENSLSLEYASQRAAELFGEIMKSEQENTIRKLQNELLEYKTLNMKLEYEKQKISGTSRELEDRLRRTEADKDKLIRDYDEVASRLEHVENQFHENLKRKEAELMHKMDNNVRRLENNLHDTEEKYFHTKKELEFCGGYMKTNEILQDEIEALRKELKSQEVFSHRQFDEVRGTCEARVVQANELLRESEKTSELLRSQFKTYQKQSEELASNHQNVIKTLVDKSKKLKQKILSQKSRLSEMNKSSKEHMQNAESNKAEFERAVSDLEEKIKVTEKEAAVRENEILVKHQNQITQLQMQYQHMMEAKLSEMQQEVDKQIFKSQEHDREVMNMMDSKMKEIEREYMLVSVHDRLIADKEIALNRKFTAKIEEVSKGNDQIQDELKREIIDIRKENEEFNQTITNLQKVEDSLKKEILREKEKLGSDLNIKLMKLKESENSRVEVGKELEKAKKQIEMLTENYNEEALKRIKADNELLVLSSTISELQGSLNAVKQNLKSTKAQYEMELSEKVDRHQYYKELEKSQYLQQEIENKSLHISRLESDLNNLQDNLHESKSKHSGDLNILELEQSRLEESKIQIKELENYSKTLLHEIEIRDNRQKEIKSVLENYKEEVRNLALIIDNKDKELISTKQSALNKELDLKYKHKNQLERTKKYVKNSIFFLKKQLTGITELFEHEYSSINKNFSTVFQEISIKVIEMQLQFRKEVDFKSELYSADVKQYYRSRFALLEEYISSENVHWSDPDTEGIRRAAKAIIEKKNIAQLEIKALMDSLGTLTEQNEALYRENQKLQMRLHANNEAFDQLQREVTEEANKIKHRLEISGGKDRMDFSTRTNYYRS